LDISYIQTELETKSLREENAKLKKVISCFLSGQHQEASKLLDLQNYFLQSQDPAILEGKVVPLDQHHSDQTEPPKKKTKQAHKEKEGEVTHMMPLSSMTMQNVLQIWNNPWVQLGKRIRPLKDIVEAPLDSESKRWGDKGIAEQAKRIRAVITLLEMLELHNVEQPIAKLEELRRIKGWSMDNDMKVSTPGKTTSATDVFYHPSYDVSQCFWKDLI